jgi:penicillin-binding protein 1A
VSEFIPPDVWTRIRHAALDADAWLNDSLYTLGCRISELYERFSIKTDRLSLSGGKRVMADLASEAFTLTLVGGVMMLVLAIPAFHESTEDFLKKQELAVTFLDRYGQEAGRRGIRLDNSVPLDEFPDHLIKAVLATEDRRFFDHFGIDVIGTARALSVNARSSGVVQGGSTITQQLAKNIFLTNERSVERKIKEAFLAIWLESRLSKHEILKLYLDRAYMGGGAFGIAAASDYYFGKTVRELSLPEAAMLAGLFKAPTKYAPHVNLPAARARARDVLSNMVEARFMSAGQIESARRNPATPVDRKRDTHPDFYLDWAFEDVKRMANEGLFGVERVLVVKTPLDTPLQAHADTTLEQILRQNGADYGTQQAALVVMDPEGGVRAMVGGRDYGASQFNRATDALRQPGSSFKPFVYATALSAGLYRPDSVVVDAPICLGNWCPNNYSRSYAGAMPLTVALAKSINTIPVRMSLQLGNGNAKLGRTKIIDTARKMGLNTELRDSSSLPIGSAEVTVLDMTAGYAVFANGGRKAQPFAALEVYNGQGDVIWRRERDAKPAEVVLSSTVVADMNFMLSKVPEEGTGKRAALNDIRSAGKTGTTNGYKDAWYVGYTGNLVAGVWFGNDDSTPTNNMTGGTLPAMTWNQVMTFAHQGIELKEMPGFSPLTAPKPLVLATPQALSPTPSGLLEISGRNTATALPLSKKSYDVIQSLGGMFERAKNTSAPRASNSPPVLGKKAARTPSQTVGQLEIISGKR